jgi:hypothetical protein
LELLRNRAEPLPRQYLERVAPDSVDGAR